MHLISGNIAWEKELIIAENHWYLNGQIGFLLRFANNNINNFKNYRDKFKALWSLSETNPKLIYQALLTKGYYLPMIGSNFTFCSFKTAVRTKLDNWQKVFNCEDEYLKDLMDDNKINVNNIENSLLQIIDDYIKNYRCKDSSYNEKHIYALVSNSSNIAYCEELQLRYSDYGQEVYLLKKYQMNGNHSELYSRDLFTKKFQNKDFAPFNIIKYIETTSYEIPFILFDDFKNRYAMKISFDQNFQIIFYKKKYKKGKIEDSIVKVLESNNFIMEGVQYILKDIELCKANSILPLIKKILNEFNNVIIK